MAGEGQQLAGQPDRLLSGHPDLLDVVGQVRRKPSVGLRERLDLLGGVVGVALDDVEQVVEVVRDAADQLPQALQPLGLLQPPLDAFLLGDGTQALPFGFHGQPLGDVPDRGGDQHPDPVAHRQPGSA